MMETRKLFKEDDFIIVETGSRKEKELLALGWHKDKVKPVKKRQDSPETVEKAVAE